MEMTDKKLCTIESTGTISQLGGISGPIHTPTKFTIREIIGMVNSGKKVYEVNPKNRNQKVLLTRLNIHSNNFAVVNSKVAIKDKAVAASITEVQNKLSATIARSSRSNGSMVTSSGSIISRINGSDF